MIFYKKEKTGQKRKITLFGMKFTYTKKSKSKSIDDGKYASEHAGYFSDVFPKNKKLVMTILARDEIDIIEENLKFHLKQGVDFIIATDNGSIDGTRDVFLKFQEQGVLKLIDEPSQDYNQAAWVDRMTKMARDEFAADWIMCIDADEFWYSDNGNIKTDIALLESKGFNCAYCSMFHIYPESWQDAENKFYDNICGYLEYMPQYGYKKCVKKCLFKAADYKMIEMGNHEAEMANKKPINYEGITVFHYTMRSYQQFEYKVRISGEALSKNYEKHKTGHMMKLYEAYLNGKFKDEYEKRLMCSNPDKNSFYDSRVRDYICNGLRNIRDFEHLEE